VPAPGEASASIHVYHACIRINLEIRQQQCCTICIHFKLRANKTIRDVNSAFTPDQSVLSLRSSAQLLHGCSAAHVSPAYAAPPSLVPYANRPFADQRRYTKRLTVVITAPNILSTGVDAQHSRFAAASPDICPLADIEPPDTDLAN